MRAFYLKFRVGQMGNVPKISKQVQYPLFPPFLSHPFQLRAAHLLLLHPHLCFLFSFLSPPFLFTHLASQNPNPTFYFPPTKKRKPKKMPKKEAKAEKGRGRAARVSEVLDRPRAVSVLLCVHKRLAHEPTVGLAQVAVCDLP